MKEFNEMKSGIESLMKIDYSNFVKALVSIETGINDISILDSKYDLFMNSDGMNLINDDIINDNVHSLSNETINSKNDYENIDVIGYVTKDVEPKKGKSKDGNEFEYANFSLVLKDEKGNKKYTNATAYKDNIKEFNKGDLVKINGKEKVTIGEDGKQYKKIIVSKSDVIVESQLKNNDKKSTLSNIDTFKDKAKDNDKKAEKSSEKNTINALAI